jgi:UDP-galactopyranose mutase
LPVAVTRTPSRLLVVGAGFSGAVLARAIAEATDLRLLVIDARSTVGGNCHTTRDPDTGVLEHVYGPHIFHTDSRRVWEYVRRFATFHPYTHRVKASTSRGIFGLPINLHTINQVFGLRLNPRQAEQFLQSKAEPGDGPARNFEEQALRWVGRELYDLFLRGYTIKQWGVDPCELPASVLRRLPVRFSYDDRYHHSRYQAIPEDGYTALISRILDHPSIDVELGQAWEPGMRDGFAHVFYTGPIESFYNHADGPLGYRTVWWTRHTGVGDLQGAAQINYTEQAEPFTRTIEPSHFAPWESHTRSVLLTEFSRETGADDTPYYPKRLAADLPRLLAYRARARADRGVSFLGRLATYRYLDMERVIEEALEFADNWLSARASGDALPIFPNRESSELDHETR